MRTFQVHFVLSRNARRNGSFFSTHKCSMLLLTIHSTSTSSYGTQNFYKQKHFCLSDLSNTFVLTVLIVKDDNSGSHSSQMDNVWSTQHRIFVFNKTRFIVFLSSFERCRLPKIPLSHSTVKLLVTLHNINRK